MLTCIIRRFSLPLLAKDLVEAANRRRTYVLRVVYALLLYTGALLIYLEEVDALNQSAIDLLGTGKELLTITFGLQCFGICLFMPALSAGAFTIEKEKNTLTLLFLTRLGPWTILFEKYLARVVHMVSYLLISLPLFGIAYSLGGVTQFEMWTAAWTLLLFTAQVGAISVACSTFFMSTPAAFIWTYLVGAALYLLPVLYTEVVGYRFIDSITPQWELFINGVALRYWHPCWVVLMKVFISDPVRIAEWIQFYPFHTRFEDISCMFFPVNVMMSTFGGGSSARGTDVWHVVVRSFPIISTILLSLGLSRVWLVSRTSVQRKNRIMQALRRVDRYFHRINQNSWTRGMVLINDTETLPINRPIAWRETKKRAFGTVRYLVRMLMLIEFPVILICLLVLFLSIDSPGSWVRSPALALLATLTWILSLLFLISKAATALPGEKLGETFDVLLTTPLKTREIVRQKFAGVNRLIWVLTIPQATIAASHAIMIQTSYRTLFDGKGVGAYLLGSAVSLLIYPRMVAWLSMLIGLMCRSQTKAIFTTLAIVVGWCILPIVGLFIWDEMLNMSLPRDSIIAHIAWAQSPMMLIGAVETGEFSLIGVIIIVSAIEYGLMTLVFRKLCLSSAAWMLGRPESNRPLGDVHVSRATEHATGVRKL